MNTLLRLISLNAARVLFVGGLLLALYVGLTWALSPQERPDAGAIAAAQVAREAAASEAAAATATEAPTEAVPTAAATPTAVPETASPAQLIAEARPPAETTVQVLDAGGGSARVDGAVAALEQLGYQVVAISPSSRDVVETTVYFTDGNQAQAEGLRARDPRFRVVEPNRGLSEGVDIHVLVGTEF